MNVFEIVEHIPKGTNLVSCKWVFKYKHDENGKITKRKARVFTTFLNRLSLHILYLAVSTRPGIMFSVSRAARKNNNPTLEDWFNVKKIFRYLITTENYGIKFSKNRNLRIFVDADYAGDEITRKSTSGFIFMIGESPTSWYSKLQNVVATSTAESEYYSISDCAKHSLWYLNILNELNINMNYVIIHVDNKAAIYNCQNQSINKRSKHIDIKYHHIRSLIKDNKIKLKYIKFNDNIADGFTKYLNNTLMDNFRNSILTKIWFGHKLNKSHSWICQKLNLRGSVTCQIIMWKLVNNVYNHPIIFLIFFYK